MQKFVNQPRWIVLAAMLACSVISLSSITIAQNFSSTAQGGEINTSARGKGRLKIQNYTAEPAITRVSVYFGLGGEVELHLEGDLPTYSLRGRVLSRLTDLVDFEITQSFGNTFTTGRGRASFRNAAFVRLDFTGKAGTRDVSILFDSTEAIATAPKPIGGITPGRYIIEIVASGHVLDLNLTDKKTLQQWSRSSANNQQWDLEDAGSGYFYIRSVETKEFLTAEDRKDGAGVITSRTARSREFQQWQIREAQNGQVTIFSRGGNRALDLPGGSSQLGRALKIYPATGEDNQRFRLVSLDQPGQPVAQNPVPVPQPPVNTGPGRVIWRGPVDDTIQLRITGASVTVQAIAGFASEGASEFTTPLPMRDTFVSARRLRGRGSVQVIQQPSSFNNYTAIIQVVDSKGGSDYHEIEVSWN